MTKKRPVVALFGNPGSAVTDMAELGLRRLDYDTLLQVPGCWRREQAERNVAAAVVTGLRDVQGQAAHYYAARQTPVAIIELPHLRGGDERQWRVTPPRHDWLPDFDGPVPTARLDALGVEVRTRQRVKAQHVLLVGQTPDDSAHGMGGSALLKWAREQLQALRSLGRGRVVWRPHPRDPHMALPEADVVSDPRRESLEDAMANAWLVVTHNSTAGLEALIAGIPVIATGPAVYSSLAHSMQEYGQIGPPDPDAVRNLLARVAWTQWSREEIETGEPLRMALDAARGVRVVLAGGAAKPRAASIMPVIRRADVPADDTEDDDEDGEQVPADDTEALPPIPDDLSTVKWQDLQALGAAHGVTVTRRKRVDIEADLDKVRGAGG